MLYLIARQLLFFQIIPGLYVHIQIHILSLDLAFISILLLLVPIVKLNHFAILTHAWISLEHPILEVLIILRVQLFCTMMLLQFFLLCGHRFLIYVLIFPPQLLLLLELCSIIFLFMKLFQILR